jgi:squalene-hopene/tetraprenyl-beta-curcumene cyclase
VQTPAQELLRSVEAPLNDRVNTEQMTQYDPPPLPERVILPMPPTFEIARNPADVPIDRAHYDAAIASLNKGIAYLAQAQHASGGWMTDARTTPTDQPDSPSPIAVAVTALAVKAMVQHDPDWIDTEAGARALRFIASAKRDDGSFEAGALSNYVTAAVVMALASVPDDDVYDLKIEAVQWLKANQWDQSEGLDGRQDWFGGAGYGNHGRPDLSNTQMMLDALYEAGVSPDEPVMQKALAFVSRAQNLKQTNKAEWTGNDGGFIYTPANGGESMGSEAAQEGRHGELIAAGQPRSLRSYGSMTYAGFKSMLYAGLSPDDVRVRAAFDWIRNHWGFDENPGLGETGLYYYYHTMSRALFVAQQNEIADANGVNHNWRQEMIDAIVQRQDQDGSWVNNADRWMEGHPVLVTVYCTLALEENLKPALNMTALRTQPHPDHAE